MHTVQLVSITPALARALDDASRPSADVERALDLRLGDTLALARSVAAGNEAYHDGLGTPPEWRAFLAVDAATREVVGTCGFKGAPDADGCIEIAYFTFPAFEGRGWGTAMAGALVARAAASGAVRTVCAHTLPEHNASGRILARNGFVRAGDGVDHEVGHVWRWERAMAAPG